MELRGEQRVESDLAPAPRKTMVSSRSFGAKVTALSALREAVAWHASSAAARLRAEGLLAGGVSVFIDTGFHAEAPFRAGAAAELARPSSASSELAAAARRALEACYRPGPLYAKCGVTLFGIVGRAEARAMRGGLFRDEPDPRPDLLMRAVDAVTAKHGKGAIRLLSEGRGTEPFWAMRRRRLSGLSTTDWDSLPRVKA
ncbi:MAG: DUF4113 domain-containing protein [Deltaproteobacteria bacterium]|nr:DUF4113 domain-containing protein [Deltaproteobacteria bacterium]